ncbi:flippase [Streptococcus danieliae]|uniref:Flippase n=1 Tax=Streptococcus danieliae TaxID=747656 RepID=A0A7Z0LD99_9STRE|nr:flippase [Streptococcus danieliae]MBF0717256.1 flippase [Streptococcus danieliae]NYS49186.1 flippase [Streptococcus danieliae]
MKKMSSVRMNFIMNFILTISNFIFPLLTFPYVSRVLQAEGIGIVNFATSIITYFSMIGMMGIPTYGIRACAKVRDDEKALSKTVQEIMILNMIVMGVSLLLLGISVFTVPQLYAEKELYLIMSSTLIFNVLGVDWLYRSLEKYTYIAIRSIIFKVISVVLMFLLVKTNTDYVIYGALTVFAAVGSNLMNFFNLRNLVHFDRLEGLNILQHLRPTLTFFMLNVSTTIYINVDTTMLGFIKGSTEVGYYSAAVKIKQILVSVVTSLGVVLLPRLSYYYEKGQQEEFQRLTQKALQFVLLVSVPLVFYFILVARDSILFLSGETFLPGVLALQLIMPTVLFIGLSNLMGIQILVPTNREHLVVVSTVVGAFVDILLNIFLIPTFGASGAAFAGSIAELSVTIVQFYVLREFLKPLLKGLPLIKIGLAIVVSTLSTVFYYSSWNFGTFPNLLLTAMMFFSSYGLILVFLKESFTLEVLGTLFAKLKH